MSLKVVWSQTICDLDASIIMVQLERVSTEITDTHVTDQTVATNEPLEVFAKSEII